MKDDLDSKDRWTERMGESTLMWLSTSKPSLEESSDKTGPKNANIPKGTTHSLSCVHTHTHPWEIVQRNREWGKFSFQQFSKCEPESITLRLRIFWGLPINICTLNYTTILCRTGHLPWHSGFPPCMQALAWIHFLGKLFHSHSRPLLSPFAFHTEGHRSTTPDIPLFQFSTASSMRHMLHLLYFPWILLPDHEGRGMPSW